MDKDTLKEKIKNYIEIRKNFWTAMLGLFGGITALSISTINNPLKNVFVIFGLIFLIFILFSIKFTNEEINLVIKKMEEAKK